MTTKKIHFVTIVLALLVAGAAIAADEPTVEPRADMLLQRMGAVLAAAEEFTLTNTFTSDETVSTGEIVQLEGTVEIALRRPDGLRASIHDDFGSKQYHYDQGVYYVKVDDGYRAVTAPIGANIPELPDDTQDVTVGSNTYYYMGSFYIGGDSGYSVVQAPAGAMVSYVPQGYTTQTINATIYYEYGGVYYQPKMVDGGTAYVVVRV
jgi:hypothetical protein